MRLLFLNHNLREHGTYFRAFHLARELAALGHDVTLWTASEEHWYRAPREQLDGVRIVETPSWNPLIDREALGLEGGRSGRNGLGWRGLFAGDIGLRHGEFDDRPDRFARLPVEDETESLFGHLCDGLDTFAVDRNVQEVRWGGIVIIPKAVMD